jgi:N4-gp56 family major capsid protein
MAGNLDTNTMANTVKAWYERRLLMRALPNLKHGMWAEEAVFDGYKSWECRKVGSLPIATTALTEGSTPGEEQAPTIGTYTITPQWYGAWIGFTDKLKVQAFDPIIDETTAVLGEQAGLTFDTLIRDHLVTSGNCTKDYSGSATSANTLDLNNDKLAYSDFLDAVTTLEAEYAKPADGAFYPALLHPHSWGTLMRDPTFITLFTREGGESIRSGYVGTILQTKIYLSGNVKEDADAGENSTEDVYHMLFFGRESYMVAGMTGMVPSWKWDSAGNQPMIGSGQKTGVRHSGIVEIIVNDLGETGFDPLKQRGTLGWKATHEEMTLNANWIIDLEHLTDNS